MIKSLLLALSITYAAGLYGVAGAAMAAETQSAKTPAASYKVTDARNREVVITDASRIASIGGAVTEILYAMGLGDRVIAVDQTSTFPLEVKAKPDVGYARTLSPEGVLSVGPSLILATDGAGPRTTIDVLEHASIPVVMIPEAHDADGVVRKIELIAAAVGEPEKGRALAEAVRADFEVVAKALEQVKDEPRAVFVMSASGGAAVVGGSDTSADAMFRLARVTNAMSAIKGYKPAQDEAAMISEPDAVIVMRDGGQKLDADTIFALPTFMGTPAARDRKLLTYPGSYLLGFGPRAPFAVRDLAVALHPGLEIPELPARPWHTELAQ
ncbi:heme/hemin ABC transporter substrate-binding protein [Xanthobacter sp. TB0136]|uniref:heme/hemin ABC transporter substrate-binding protein n=1 Tax=Xanthobacter sp. TB0136 TaxID=3459177 RepID=UPI0040399D6C